MTIKTAQSIAIASILLVAATLCISLFNLDMVVADIFFVPGQGFTLANNQPWRALYAFGEYPGLFLAIAAALAVIATYRWPGYRAWRKPCLFLALLYLLGPGLVVNALLKDHWGRPRPVDTAYFGGTQPFHQPWIPEYGSGGKSFPSGHASVAFFLIGPYFFLRYRQRKAALIWLSSGSVYGGLVGAARLVQGGHFLSDIVWSGGLVALTGLVLADIMRLNAKPTVAIVSQPDVVPLNVLPQTTLVPVHHQTPQTRMVKPTR